MFKHAFFCSIIIVYICQFPNQLLRLKINKKNMSWFGREHVIQLITEFEIGPIHAILYAAYCYGS